MCWLVELRTDSERSYRNKYFIMASAAAAITGARMGQQSMAMNASPMQENLSDSMGSQGSSSLSSSSRMLQQVQFAARHKVRPHNTGPGGYLRDISLNLEVTDTIGFGQGVSGATSSMNLRGPTRIVQRHLAEQRENNNFTKAARPSELNPVSEKVDPLANTSKGGCYSCCWGSIKAINPHQHYFMNIWDLWVIIALGYTLTITPFEVCFVNSKPGLSVMFWLNTIIDFTFIIDTILQFLIMYPERTSTGTIFVGDFKKIAWRYLTSWFIVDILAIPPFDLIMFIADANSENGVDLQQFRIFKLVRCLRIVKIFRILNTSQLVKKVQMEFGHSKQKQSLYSYVILGLFAAHFMSCIWGLTAESSKVIETMSTDEQIPFYEDSWYRHDPLIYDVHYNTDLCRRYEHHFETNPGEPWLEEVPENCAEWYDWYDSIHWTKYVACLYWSIMTLSSIGYGDIYPRNMRERLVAVLMMLMGSLVWAVILGGVTAVRTTLEQNNNIFAQEIDQLNELMAKNYVDDHLRVKVREYWHEQQTTRASLMYYTMMRKLSPGLKWQTCQYVNEQSKMTENICFFVGINPSCIADLTLAFEVNLYAHGDDFGDIFTCYYLERGLVSCPKGHGIFSRDDENVARGFGAWKMCDNGTCWGTDFVLDNASLCFSPKVLCFTIVQVNSLRKDSLVDIMQHHPEDKRKLRKYAKKLAFQRGMLRHAVDDIKHRKDQNRYTGTHLSKKQIKRMYENT